MKRNGRQDFKGYRQSDEQTADGVIVSNIFEDGENL